MDEFYQKTYLMIVFKWSYYYTRKNMKNVRCDIIEDTKNYHTVNVIKLRIDSYQGIQTKCMPFLFSLDKSQKM